MEYKIKKIKKSDRKWIAKFFVENWGSDFIVSRGKIHRSENLEGFFLRERQKVIGLVTARIEKDELEVVSLNSLETGRGIGSKLIEKIINVAKEKKLKRIWLVTTNDNLISLSFYQKRGFHLVAIYPDALDKSRKIKPQIPKIGENGIPLRDEIELEMSLV